MPAASTSTNRSTRSGRITRLGTTGDCIGGGASVNHVALAADTVAYGLHHCGVDTGFTQVLVQRLRDGARLGSFSATEKSPPDRRRWFIVAVLSIFATVITHHVTSYMLTAFLILVAIASRVTGSRNTAMRFGILATISALSVICWIAFSVLLVLSMTSGFCPQAVPAIIPKKTIPVVSFIGSPAF